MGMSFLVRAIGFFNDAYDLFVMSIVNVILTYQYPKEYTPAMKSTVSTTVFFGSVLGQLIFGYYADQLGRKKIMIYTASLLIVGGILSCSAYGGNPTATLSLLAVYRGILGFGIGGEYPLSCTYTAESSETSQRGRNVSSTFSMQGVGQLFAALMSNILIQLFANSPEKKMGSNGEETLMYDSKSLEIIWRVLFGIGAIPAICILYPRYKSEDSEHFTSQEQLHMPSFRAKVSFIIRHYGKRLLGTAGTWFLFDIVFYSQSIFSATILSDAAYGTDHSLQMTSLKYVLLASAALPGYFIAVLTIDKIGRKNMQLQGFFFMGIIFAILGIYWDNIRHNNVLFLFLYGLTFFFSNFGPNTTSFLLPVEAFPTALRATCHGISAAAGKIGAIFGAALFAPLEDKYGTANVFLLCSLICLISIPLTCSYVIDRPGDLELLEEELKRFIEMEDEVTKPCLKASSHTVCTTGYEGKISKPSVHI